jgi:hypothetical protein
MLGGDDIPGAAVDVGADEYLPTGDEGNYDEIGDADGFALATLAAGYGTLYDEGMLTGVAQQFGRSDPY